MTDAQHATKSWKGLDWFRKLEIFKFEGQGKAIRWHNADGTPLLVGWYPIGPFPTEKLALQNAQISAKTLNREVLKARKEKPNEHLPRL